MHKLFVLYQGYEFKHGENVTQVTHKCLLVRKLYMIHSSKSLSHSMYRMDGTFIDQLVHIFIPF